MIALLCVALLAHGALAQSPANCGISNIPDAGTERPTSRIVGGWEVIPTELPYQTAMIYFGSQYCGGSILNENWVLTAAHCDVLENSSEQIWAGIHSLRNDDDDNVQKRGVGRVIEHPNFDYWELDNDFALVRVDSPWDLDETTGVNSVCLEDTDFGAGEEVLVSGWGTLRSGGNSPNELHATHVDLITNQECSEAYRPSGLDIFDSMICARRAGRDSCQGDSGGPLAIKQGNRFTEVGVVSWGLGCADSRYPGVYSRINHVYDWINRNIQN